MAKPKPIANASAINRTMRAPVMLHEEKASALVIRTRTTVAVRATDVRMAPPRSNAPRRKRALQLLDVGVRVGTERSWLLPLHA